MILSLKVDLRIADRRFEHCCSQLVTGNGEQLSVTMDPSTKDIRKYYE